jgi:beta-hydroxylase
MAQVEGLRGTRRRLVKQLGKRGIRGLWDFFGRQSLVGDAPVLDLALFPSLLPLEQNWQLIRSELDAILAERASIPSFHEISPDQYKISRGDDWKTYMLWGFGEPVQTACRSCPETARLLQTIPGLQSAFFSILAPGFHVRPHKGVSRGILRAHLGLTVPANRESCYMHVGDETIVWEEGKCVVFDDTYRHEVFNNTDEERVVLLIDFDRPMRLPGRAVSKAFVWGIKRTAYFKDPKRNLEEWEKQLQIEG